MPSADSANGTARAALRRMARSEPRLAARFVIHLLRERRRLRGNGRKAPGLRHLGTEGGLRELARLGAKIDPDLVFRALAYAIDPDWARGHRFRAIYELTGEGGGTWVVEVDDGAVRVEAATGDTPADATVRVSFEDWLALLRGDITPSESMRQGRTVVTGQLHPVTLLGRWIDRAEGLDGPELDRERRQRDVQSRRAGSWGASANGSAPGMGDPAHAAASRARKGDLLGYQELYALWERRNWRVHELDFELDKQHWLATPEEGQRHMAWTLGSFYVGEERVTADLAPFLLAAPSGEVEAFLATQLVDEARHAVFFDRFAAEVLALSADDLRGRLHETEDTMLGAWHFLFDDSLRDVANRIKARPDDLELFVEGIVTYHMVTEGVLAMTGQRTILQYLADHDLYPGFQRGFSLVEQDEHRHIAFGVRFLRDVCEERPEMRGLILRTLERLLPGAALVFVSPEEQDNPADFTSYGYHASQVYGHAYIALKRRMQVIGVEIPPPEKLMPGPIDPAGLEGGQRPAPVAAGN